MEDAVLLEMFKKRFVVLNANLEKLEKLCVPPNAPPTSLLRLPFEIRLQIYHYCIPRKRERVIEVSRPRFNTSWPFDRTLDFEDALDFEDDLDLEDDPHLEGEAVLEVRILDLEDYVLDFDGDWWNRNKNKNSIFLLSKQISAEALDVLYGDNIFKLQLHEQGEISS
jgi:hypothetical protein